MIPLYYPRPVVILCWAAEIRVGPNVFPLLRLPKPEADRASLFDIDVQMKRRYLIPTY